MEFTKTENKELAEAERKSFGEKLYTLRKKNGLSQQAVAEVLQVSRQSISRWEVGSSVPTMENLRLLSQLYGVPVDYLIHTEGDQAVRIEKVNMDHKKKKWKNRMIWLAFVLTVVVAVAVVIGLITVPRDAEAVNFNAIGQENWNGLSTDEIPIEW